MGLISPFFGFPEAQPGLHSERADASHHMSLMIGSSFMLSLRSVTFAASYASLPGHLIHMEDPSSNSYGPDRHQPALR